MVIQTAKKKHVNIWTSHFHLLYFTTFPLGVFNWRTCTDHGFQDMSQVADDEYHSTRSQETYIKQEIKFDSPV